MRRRAWEGDLAMTGRSAWAVVGALHESIMFSWASGVNL